VDFSFYGQGTVNMILIRSYIECSLKRATKKLQKKLRFPGSIGLQPSAGPASHSTWAEKEKAAALQLRSGKQALRGSG